MSAIRYRPNGVCAQVLGEIPGGTAYIKTKPKSGPLQAFPVKWCGFVCRCRAPKLPMSRQAKLEATAVTNGDVVGHEWRDLKVGEYVLCMLIQIGGAHEFGAFGIVGHDNWPVVLSDSGPRLTLVDSKRKEPKVRALARG
jgi:hypothetical protein